MRHSSNLSNPTQRKTVRRSMLHRSYSPICHRQASKPAHSHSEQQATILVVAEENLRLHLRNLLSAHGYTVYAATDQVAVLEILTIAPIDIVLLHHTPSTEYGGWETYTQLRQSTTKPVMAIANITVDHFDTGETTKVNQTASVDLMNYLKSIAFLCRTLIR